MTFRPAELLLGLSMAAFVPAMAAPPSAPVDACKMIDPVAVASAAKAWFSVPVMLAKDSAPGPRAGSCSFTTDSPQHIDITIFYAPSANPSMYGLGQPPPPNETPVSGVGDKAVFDQDANLANRYKTENLAILKGNAVLVLSLTLDQKLAFVAKEKLADFAARQLAPKM